VNEIALRKATSADATSALALVRELGYGGLDELIFARVFSAVLDAPSQQVWLAEQNDVIAGLMSIIIKPQIRLAGFVVTIDELVVTEASRGEGVGTKLLDLAKAEALRVRARRLELHTARGRPSYERGFYVKNGFTEVDSAVMRWNGLPLRSGG
jgi:N-acetylglutamate synthase-like GNAT family acetyltransferase